MTQQTLTVEQLKELAESKWVGFDGSNQSDKIIWINGFVIGALSYEAYRLDAILTNLKDAENVQN